MKIINILPFKEFWQDCFNCIVYSITEYSQSVPRLYYYNNMYKYNFTEETGTKNGVKYKSLVPWTDNFRLYDELTINQEKVNLAKIQKPIQFIKEKIDEEKIVLLAVDLFYWVDGGLHYMKTHLMHESLVIGYDDDKTELIVLEITSRKGYSEQRIDYQQAVKAIRGATISSYVSEIDRSMQIKMYTKDDLAFYAKQIIDSIDEKILNKDDIWRIEGFSDEDLSEMLLVVQTHVYSMQNRSYINAYMFENVFENNCIQGLSFCEKFYELEKGFERLKGVLVRLHYKTNKYQEILKVKESILNMLVLERGLWQHYINYFDEMRMKCEE